MPRLKTEPLLAEHDLKQSKPQWHEKHSEHFLNYPESYYKVQNLAAYSYSKQSQQSGHWVKISEWLDGKSVKKSSGKIKVGGRYWQLATKFSYIFHRDLNISKWKPDCRKTNVKSWLLLHEWRDTSIGKTAKHKKRQLKIRKYFAMFRIKGTKARYISLKAVVSAFET